MLASPPTAATPSRTMTRVVWGTVIVLCLIGVLAVLRRGYTLMMPPVVSRFSDAADVDSGFLRHRWLTLVHIIPGLLFMVLGPLQFARTLRARRPKLHRWLGRVFVAASLVIGVSALVMSPQMAIGGVNETIATMLFAVLFLISLMKAFFYARQRKFTLHREWMIRAFAIGLSVATIRPIVGVFFATSRLTHLTPHEFFGTAFWLGFTVQLLAAEVWINYTRPAKAR